MTIDDDDDDDDDEEEEEEKEEAEEKAEGRGGGGRQRRWWDDDNANDADGDDGRGRGIKPNNCFQDSPSETLSTTQNHWSPFQSMVASSDASHKASLEFDFPVFYLGASVTSCANHRSTGPLWLPPN